MGLFQKPASTPEEVDAQKPLDVGPEAVMEMTEKEWYARVYRGENVPQLTLRAVGMGCLLGFFLAFTNLYVGLKTGWYLGVAITACILSYSIWNFAQRLGLAKTPMSILENNCMQSAASCAGYGTGSSIITAIPAMLLLTTTPTDAQGHNLPWPIVALWTFVLGCFGVALAIPMKRNMINRERLRFPEGTAAAVTLQGLFSHGAEALKKARALYIAAIVGALTPLVKDLEIVKSTGADGKVTHSTILPGTTPIFDWLPAWTIDGKVTKWSAWTVKLDNSFVLIAAGAIMGFRPAASMFFGALVLAGAIGPYALSPNELWTNPAGALVHAAKGTGTAWRDIGLWYGAPLMVSFGLVTFALQGKMILRAFKGAGKTHEGDADDAISREVECPTSWFWIGSIVSGIAVIFVADRYFAIPIHMGVIAVALTFALTLVSARATGETSVTPVGPMGKLMQLSYGVLMPQNATANLMTASISANASSSCADLLNDLKVGYLLGANPRRQFIAQCCGIVVGTVATTLGYFIMVPNALVLTGDAVKDAQFPAPAAQQWKAVADVFRLGIENLHPMARQGIAVGLALGALLALMEGAMPKAKKFLPSATGVGLGMMLPFYTPFAFFVGAVVAIAFEHVNKKNAERFTVPIASGIIAGESILGVVVAAMNNFVIPRFF